MSGVHADDAPLMRTIAAGLGPKKGRAWMSAYSTDKIIPKHYIAFL